MVKRNFTKNISHQKRDGLPQFWEVFHSCIDNIEGNSSSKPVLSKSEYETRLQIGLLKSTKKYEVWLVASSFVALYGNGKKTGNKEMSPVTYESWNGNT